MEAIMVVVRHTSLFSSEVKREMQMVTLLMVWKNGGLIIIMAVVMAGINYFSRKVNFNNGFVINRPCASLCRAFLQIMTRYSGENGLNFR